MGGWVVLRWVFWRAWRAQGAAYLGGPKAHLFPGRFLKQTRRELGGRGGGCALPQVAVASLDDQDMVSAPGCEWITLSRQAY